MRYWLKTGSIAALLCGAVLPFAAHAQIHSVIDVSADSGGNIVQSGETLHTGAASVEVRTSTYGASSTVRIRTNVNGQAHEQQYTVSGDRRIAVSSTSARAPATVARAPAGNWFLGLLSHILYFMRQ